MGAGDGGGGEEHDADPCSDIFLAWAHYSLPGPLVTVPQLTSRDRNFISSTVPGLEEPGQGGGMGRGFEGHLSSENVSSHRYGRAFYLSPSLYPFLATHLAAWNKGLHFPSSHVAEHGHVTQF